MMILQEDRKIVYSGHNVNKVVRDGITTYYVNVRVNLENLQGHHVGSDVIIYQVDKFRRLDSVFMADEILKKYYGELVW